MGRDQLVRPQLNQVIIHESPIGTVAYNKKYELLIFSLEASRKPVGCLLMWQSIISPMFLQLNGRDSLPYRNLKCFFLGAIILSSIPVTAAALATMHGFRIASGVSSSTSAVVIIPLRTLDEIPTAAHIIAYVVWAASFSVYLWLQLKILPGGLGVRRKLFLFSVITASIHFCIAISQNSDTIVQGFTVYGPVILTVCTYLMSLLFGGLEMPEVEVNPATVLSATLGP